MTLKRNSFLENSILPVDIVLAPEWWYQNEKITFDRDSANPFLIGVCCINMDNSVSDDRIDTIFETVQNLRKEACDLQ